MVFGLIRVSVIFDCITVISVACIGVTGVDVGVVVCVTWLRCRIVLAWIGGLIAGGVVATICTPWIRRRIVVVLIGSVVIVARGG